MESICGLCYSTYSHVDTNIHIWCSDKKTNKQKIIEKKELVLIFFVCIYWVQYSFSYTRLLTFLVCGYTSYKDVRVYYFKKKKKKIVILFLSISVKLH